MKRTLIAGAAVALTALIGLTPLAHAERAVVAIGPGGYVAQYGPPAPVREVIPAARDGYVWSPGHYDWRGGRYTWVQGHWMRDRPGWEWREATWVQQADGVWILTQGEWVRNERYSAYDERRGPNGDRDRDGIVNRDDGDRDGDGVLNWRDAYPNDPNRS